MAPNYLLNACFILSKTFSSCPAAAAGLPAVTGGALADAAAAASGGVGVGYALGLPLPASAVSTLPAGGATICATGGCSAYGGAAAGTPPSSAAHTPSRLVAAVPAGHTSQHGQHGDVGLNKAVSQQSPCGDGGAPWHR